MPNMPNTSQVRFNPAQGTIADYVLNHPTASPFKQHNISFHIDGNYMTDFTREGIKDFVKDNNRKLSYQEVGAFIQTVAANAPQAAGASFNLEDRELGLYKKDDVNKQHIQTGFMLETKSGELPSQGVVFFDATSATHPLKDAEAAIERAEDVLKGAEKNFERAEDKVEDAQYLRQRLVDFLGKDSPRELAELQSRVSNLENEIGALESDKTRYQGELDGLRDDHNNQKQTPGMDQGQRWRRIQDLERVLRGVDFELRDSKKELSDTKKEISSKQGPLSFMGVGNSLQELHERNQNLSGAQDRLQGARVERDAARTQLAEAKSLRDRILAGDGLFPDAPKPTPVQPAPQQPEPPVQEPEPPPVVDEPQQPDPVAEEPPVQEPEPPSPDDGADNIFHPEPDPVQPAPQKPPVQEPQQPAPVQPAPQQPVVEVPDAPPAPQYPDIVVPEDSGRVFFQDGQNNPNVFRGSTASTVPVAPAPQQPAPVKPTPQQPSPPVISEPAPVQPAPQQPTQPAQPVAPTNPVDDGLVSKILYTVKSGDTLSSIAQSELGNFRRWTEIADMNRKVIGNQHHWIYPGQELTLPPLNGGSTD